MYEGWQDSLPHAVRYARRLTRKLPSWIREELDQVVRVRLWRCGKEFQAARGIPWLSFWKQRVRWAVLASAREMRMGGRYANKPLTFQLRARRVQPRERHSGLLYQDENVLIDRHPSPLEVAGHADERQHYHRQIRNMAYSQMPLRYRRALFLISIRGVRAKDAAALLGLKEANAASQMAFQARKRLRRLFLWRSMGL